MLNALQIDKKLHLIDETLKIREKVLGTSEFEFCQSVAVQLYHPTLIRWLPLLYVYYKWITVL